MAEIRTIREMLMTYGYNGGKPLSDEELVALMAKESEAIDLKLLGPILEVVQGKISKSITAQVTRVMGSVNKPG